MIFLEYVNALYQALSTIARTIKKEQNLQSKPPPFHPEDLESGGENTSNKGKANQKYKKSLNDSIIAAILNRRGYFFMAVPFALLFAINYYILEPSNFASFSDTLRYFISALSTLLAVVVSFNTLALRNQLNNMPTSIESLDKQLDKIESLLKHESQDKNQQNTLEDDNNDFNPFLFYSDAIKAMLITTKTQAISLIDMSKNDKDNHRKQKIRLYRGLVEQINQKLEMYGRHKDPFYLVSIPTTPYVQQMRFTLQHEDDDDSQQKEKELFESAKRVHILRNIGVRIFIRNALTKLSFEMLLFTIPIITFAAIISAISNYGSYDTLYLRLLFAGSMSTVALPFILLFVRTMPVLQLIKSSPSIPFEWKH